MLHHKLVWKVFSLSSGRQISNEQKQMNLLVSSSINANGLLLNSTIIETFTLHDYLFVVYCNLVLFYLSFRSRFLLYYLYVNVFPEYFITK